MYTLIPYFVGECHRTTARSVHGSGHLETPDQREVLGWLVGAVSQFVGLDDKGRLLERRLDTLSIYTARYIEPQTNDWLYSIVIM
jgi:hypothetical protein